MRNIDIEKRLDTDTSDLYEDTTNFLQDNLKRVQEEFKAKKNEVVKERLDILGIEMDLEKEGRRRFKSFMVESGPDEETIYYNDGTEEGLRIVTFIKPKDSIDGNTWSFKLNYY